MYNLQHIKLWRKILTGEVDGKTRLGDVKISLKLNSDNIERRVDSLGQQRTANLLQRHLILRRPIPNLQNVMGGLCVECKKLETGGGEQKRLSSVNAII